MVSKRQSPRLKELSVFFPLYNEERNVTPLVEEGLKVFPQVAKKFEIILVNDGSSDSTKKVAASLTNKYKQVRLVNQKNKGYGGAVKRGLKEAKYKWIFFSDGDLQFRLSEIKKFVPAAAADKADLIIGYRRSRAEGAFRQLIADALKVWNKELLGFPVFIKDIDCAFKLIKREVVEDMGKLKSDGAMVTTEFLLKAHNRGYRFKQLGVTHFKRKYGASTGNDLKVIRRAVTDTFILRQMLLKRELPKRDIFGIKSLRPVFKFRPAQLRML